MYRLCEVVQVDSVEMEQIIAYEASRGRHPGSKLDSSSSRSAICYDAGSRTGASPDVIQVLQTVKALLVKAKDRQIELEKSEAQLTKSAKQVRSVSI